MGCTAPHFGKQGCMCALALAAGIKNSLCNRGQHCRWTNRQLTDSTGPCLVGCCCNSPTTATTHLLHMCATTHHHRRCHHREPSPLLPSLSRCRCRHLQVQASGAAASPLLSSSLKWFSKPVYALTAVRTRLRRRVRRRCTLPYQPRLRPRARWPWGCPARGLIAASSNAPDHRIVHRQW